MNAQKKKSLHNHAPPIDIQSSAKAVATEDQLRQREFWRAEIQALSGERFTSLDAAVSRIADKVLERLGGDPSRRFDEKKFLTDVLLTDKLLCRDIRRILKL